MIRKFTCAVVAGSICVLVPGIGSSQSASVPIVVGLSPSTYARNFELREGEAVDVRTGKTWLRCNLGQHWDVQLAKCDGAATLMTREEALESLQEAADGWRLPSASELLQVLKDACIQASAKVPSTVFPFLLDRLYTTDSLNLKSGRPLAVRGCFADGPTELYGSQRGPVLVVRDKPARR